MLRFMPKDSKMVKGVKISCLGDMKVLGKEQYISTAIPPTIPYSSMKTKLEIGTSRRPQRRSLPTWMFPSYFEDVLWI